MAIKIGHASKDERGKFSGGAAGDQTGKEVCIRSWYNGRWDFVARPRRPEVAEAIAYNCGILCADPDMGYDQSQRNTAIQEAKRLDYALEELDTPVESDCSGFVTLCVQAAGVDIWQGGNSPTTRTLRKALEATGEFEILTEPIYLTTDAYLQLGDVLCKEGEHTVMVLENGSKAGQEALKLKEDTVTVYYSVRLPLLQKGSEGAAVENLQRLLVGHGYGLGRFGPNKDGVDGEFGAATENALEAFQEDMGLDPDGKCGPKTWAALITT